MKVAGIVAEYNPFHNGHKYQIDTLKQNGFTHIVTAVSGNFVQRGDFAVADKWTRTDIAIQNGVDLVFEIPTAFCLAPAEKYCSYAVEMLDNSGIIDYLCFGSECGDVEALSKIAYEVLFDTSIDRVLKENLKNGVTFAAAREKAVEEIYGAEYSNILRNPNDVLATEYLRALKNLGSNIKPLAIKREGAGHNDTEVSGKFASAAEIRRMIKTGCDYSDFVPQSTFLQLDHQKTENRFPVFYENAERVILAGLRRLCECDFERLSDNSEGFHNRLFSAVRTADSLESLYFNAKTKRYTLARIRRLYFNALLGIFDYKKPPYIKVLGLSENGKDLLGIMKKKSKLPVVSSYGEAKKLSDEAKSYFEKEAEYTDFYSIFMPKAGPCGAEFGKVRKPEFPLL